MLRRIIMAAGALYRARTEHVAREALLSRQAALSMGSSSRVVKCQYHGLD